MPIKRPPPLRNPMQNRNSEGNCRLLSRKVIPPQVRKVQELLPRRQVLASAAQLPAPRDAERAVEEAVVGLVDFEVHEPGWEAVAAVFTKLLGRDVEGR